MNCPKCYGDMWDNRERKQNPRAPDFKCKDKNCDGVIWPPKGARGSAPASSAAPRRAANGNGGKEGYWERKEARDLEQQPRIERQHSQEMAIRYASLKGLDAIDNEKLCALIDWFQRDIGKLSTTEHRDVEPDQQDIGGEISPPDDEY